MFDDLQGYFESTLGQILTISIIAVFFLFILIPTKAQKNKRADTKAVTLSALMVALATGLGMLKLFEMPYGGTVTVFSMLPIVLCGYFLGTRRGVMAGMCVGLLNLIFGPYVIHPVQLLVDYPFAFGALGLSGLCSKQKNGLFKGYIIGLIGRYICAVISGIVFFGAYAPEEFNPVTWSFFYNFTYLAAEGVLTLMIISIPPVKKALEGLKSQL